ncbi:DEAD/DEAH box helicase [Nonomuraea fuscirosea]|uniref:DEAD/DEAH box helicase n=1 Tax=Nonomuraea fuscirosea TaxID=1291556 RepID=UPI002DDC1AE8|nr:DEAD/DEAH box helicase [Nonomuraea fuscirosea]WSA53599.1 DEAD/DEAH box helicase [Nonomuraea fuscirosea]
MTLERRISLYESAFAEDGGDALIGRAQISYIVEALTGKSEPIETDGIDLRDVAWSFESLGVEASRSGFPERQLIGIFEKAFRIRSSLLAAEDSMTLTDVWLLIASGLASQNQPQVRETLGEIDWPGRFGDAPTQWDQRVLWESTRALFHLTRKRGGWEDIDIALRALKDLVLLQREQEPDLLAQQQPDSAALLLGLYHLAEGLTTLGEYLRTGSPDSALSTIERNTEHSLHLLQSTGEEDLIKIASAAVVVLPQLVRASIWHNTSRLSEAARQFARNLTESTENQPVLELWWAQREALAQNLLDPFKIAIGVQMPTSAGKTLLAEFSIVQTLALNPSSTVAYLVPTRALVNQVTRRLRQDLEGSDIQGRTILVEAAVPVFELDPTENAMLTYRPDVLVTTPEKLDLLVRSGHPVARDIALLVVDEAHHISEPSRGPRLELLLATLKRERRASCRYLLLTPFLPNADELARWLGDADHAAISLDWRPALQIRALGHWRRKRKKFHDALDLVPSVTQPPEWQGVEIDLGESHLQPATRSRPGISASTAASLALSGASTLILTKGPGTAEERALRVAEILGSAGVVEEDPVLDVVIKYVSEELGESYPLVRTLRHGVAFHHAGLPPEVRSLVERLLEKGTVKVLAGTTTLAQGVNFPLAAVIVETLRVSQGRGKKWRSLQYSEFWNIAGRAGRALQDRIGAVIWPSDGKASDREFLEFLEGEAASVVSALAGALSSIDEASPEYNLSLVRNDPSLSHFLQYLAHALKVGGFAQASAEIEDILRSSLVFHRMRGENRDDAERLVRWSRRFLEASRGERLLNVADATGLSLPSVGLIASTAAPEMRSPAFWSPDNLFGHDLSSLISTIELLSEVPELSLGLSDERGGLNKWRVAGILRDWVNGATLPEIVDSWAPPGNQADSLRTIGRYLFRDLTGQMPWGLGALQLVTMADSGGPEQLLDAKRVPAMAFYGVKSRGAIALRMVGVPRVAAEYLGQRAPEFSSFSNARKWAGDQPASDWGGPSRDQDRASLKQIWELTSL